MKSIDRSKNFERSLPDGYREVLHISAKDVKVGLLMNLGALVVTALAYIITVLPTVAFILPRLSRASAELDVDFHFVAGIMIGAIAFLPFIVLHELIHGWAYKKKTGEKLTFGMSWSCAYCGLPGIYTYRATALFALLAPMVVISAVTLLGAAVCAVISLRTYPTNAAQSVLVFLIGAFISLFSCHLGGCVGDGYMAILFATKLRDPKTLMRDTGPEQFAYIPDPDYHESKADTESCEGESYADSCGGEGNSKSCEPECGANPSAGEDDRNSRVGEGDTEA